MRPTIQLFRGRFQIEDRNAIATIQSRLFIELRGFRRRTGRLRIEPKRLNGYVRESGALRLPMASYPTVIDILGDANLEFRRLPLLWDQLLIPDRGVSQFLKLLPDFAGVIPLRSGRDKCRLLLEIIHALKEPFRHTLLYVCRDHARQQQVLNFLRRHIPSNMFEPEVDCVGPIEVVVANNWGVRPIDVALFIDDPFLLATSVGRRYWESSIRNDVPLFVFEPGSNIRPRDRLIIDFLAGSGADQ